MVKTSLSPPKLIHFGYRCDYCLQDPIVGPRFNCYQCDFDICQSCEYKTTIISNNKKHVHPLWRYDKIVVESSINDNNNNNNNNDNDIIVNNNKLELEELDEIILMNNDDNNNDDNIIYDSYKYVYDEDEKANNEIVELLDMTLDPSKYVEELMTKINFNPLYDNFDNSISSSSISNPHDKKWNRKFITFNIPEVYLRLDLNKQQLILDELKSVCSSNNIFFASDINDTQCWKFTLHSPLLVENTPYSSNYELPDLINKL